jgi:hypothetical protein
MLTSPTNGQLVALPPLLNATAADPDNDLVRVSFYADGDQVGEDTTAPYSFIWSNAVAGVHSLYAVAIDAGGRQLTSAVANVTLAFAISNTLVPAGAVWRYFDKTNDLGFDFELTGTVVLAQAPELQAILAGSSLLLIAPADATYFTLHSATNLTPPVNWIPATNTAVLTNNQWCVTMPVPTNGLHFFRLQTT